MSSKQVIISLVLGLMWVMCKEVSAVEWKFYTRSEFGLYQYDIEDVSYLSNNLVRVSQKLVLNDRGITNLVRELGKEYRNVKEIVTFREIDCKGRKNRILGLIYYSENSRVIKRESYELIEWDSIIPNSVDDILSQAICK